MESQEDVYLQFEAFDFDTEDFQNGLANIYESYLDQLNQQNDGQINELVTEIKPQEKARLEIQAKTFYFCSQTGNILNIEDYEQWKIDKKLELEKELIEEDAKEEAGYSSNYQQIVQLILEGKEVPGIKQIPDTVLEGSSSEATIQTRKKPWEIQAKAEASKAEEAKESVSEDDVVEEKQANKSV